MSIEHDLRGNFSSGPGRMQAMKLHVDFHETPLTSGNIARLFNVPKGILIDHIKVNRKLAEGGTATIDVGLYAQSNDAAIDADGLLDGTDINATGYVASRPGVLAEAAPNTYNPAYSNGYLATVDAWVGVLANNDLDLAQLDIELFYIA